MAKTNPQNLSIFLSLSHTNHWSFCGGCVFHFLLLPKRDPAHSILSMKGLHTGILILMTTVVCLADLSPSTPWPAEAESLQGERIEVVWPEKAVAWVWIFIAAECPVANKSLPALRKLFRDLADRGVAFLLVYCDPVLTAAEDRQHYEDYQTGLPAVRDPRHQLVRHAGITYTPEAVVFLPDGSLHYRGRIDNRYTGFGKARPRATRHDLRNCLQSLLNGESQPFTEIPGFGCPVHEIPPQPDP